MNSISICIALLEHALNILRTLLGSSIHELHLVRRWWGRWVDTRNNEYHKAYSEFMS